MLLPSWTAGLAAAAAAISITVALWQRIWFRLPPGPWPWPVVGNLYQIKPVRFRCFAEWASLYGPIMSVWFGTTLNVVVSSTDLAREVLKEKDQFLADRPRNRSAARFSRNGVDLVWADYGPHYVKVRKVCNLELFSPKRMEALRPIREDEVTAMVDSIFKEITRKDMIGQRVLVLRNQLSGVAFNNITRLAFGKRFVNSEGVVDEEGRELKGVVANGLKFGASLSAAEYIPWMRWMFPLDEGAYARHGARRDRLTRAIMEEHARAREAGEASRHHFVEALLELRGEHDLSEDTVIGLLWDMITAGMDTTVIAVEWAMAELLRAPEVQKKVQAELDLAVGSSRIMTEADFSKLQYLQCVVKEALRLHPPTPLMLPHKAATHVRIGGYDVPRGSVVHVNVWALARDPAVWKDPEEFRPERFEEEDVDIRGHDFRVLPFGAGRRVCPGAQLGINLVQSMLGHLLHHFHWSLPEGVHYIDMAENPGMVAFMRTPLQVVPTPRLADARLYTRLPADIL